MSVFDQQVQALRANNEVHPSAIDEALAIFSRLGDAAKERAALSQSRDGVSLCWPRYAIFCEIDPGDYEIQLLATDVRAEGAITTTGDVDDATRLLNAEFARLIRENLL